MTDTATDTAKIMHEAGLKVDFKYSDDEVTYAENDTFRFRALHYVEPPVSKHELHIGVAAEFDRWANSLDYAAPLPVSVEHMKRIIVAVDKELANTPVYPGYGSGKMLTVEP